MKTLALTLLALGLLPITGRADAPGTPWAASAQAPTAFTVPIGQDEAVMAQAASLINGWQSRDSHMYPMPIRSDTPALIQTDAPTAIGLFGVKVTDTHSTGVAVIVVETSAFEGRIFQVSRERHDADKRAHLLAYLLEQTAGVPTSPPLPTFAPPSPAPPNPLPTASPFAPSLDQLRSELDGGHYDAALATLDALRAAVVARQAQGGPDSK